MSIDPLEIKLSNACIVKSVLTKMNLGFKLSQAGQITKLDKKRISIGLKIKIYFLMHKTPIA